jgi:hypothetical protein
VGILRLKRQGIGYYSHQIKNRAKEISFGGNVLNVVKSYIQRQRKIDKNIMPFAVDVEQRWKVRIRMTITKYDRVAILPKRCDRCNRLFWLEPYNIFYKTVGIEAYSLKQIACKNCVGKAESEDKK